MSLGAQIAGIAGKATAAVGGGPILGGLVIAGLVVGGPAGGFAGQPKAPRTPHPPRAPRPGPAPPPGDTQTPPPGPPPVREPAPPVFTRISASNNMMRPNGTCGLPTQATIAAVVKDASATTAKLYYTPPDGTEAGPFKMTGPTGPIPNGGTFHVVITSLPTWNLATRNF